jgi:hypothetical protein
MGLERMSDLDPHGCGFDAPFAIGMERAKTKFYEYQARGAWDKAHGLAVGIKIFYDTMTGDFSDTLPTQRGDL